MLTPVTEAPLLKVKLPKNERFAVPVVVKLPVSVPAPWKVKKKELLVTVPELLKVEVMRLASVLFLMKVPCC